MNTGRCPSLHFNNRSPFNSTSRTAVLAFSLLFSSFGASAQQVNVAAFEDVSIRLGPLAAQRTWGATWSDFDNDGWPDLFLNNHNLAAPYVLHNQLGESFANISANSNLSKKTDHHSCKWADFDRDEDWDLYCSTGAGRGTKSVPMRFMRNRGTGEFDDIAAESGTAFPTGRGRAVSWFDADGDNDLDLFVGTEVKTVDNPKSKLFSKDNGAALLFSDITVASGINLDGQVLNSIPFDFDNDDDTDLLVSFRARQGVTLPCTRCVAFLVNDGSGRFRAISGASRGLKGPTQLTVALGDYDNDGDLDVFYGNRNPSARLHRNNGDATFSEISLVSAGLSAVDDFPVIDSLWADFDNDGHLDLYVVRNNKSGDPNAPDKLFLNDGDGSFTDATSQFSAQGLHTGQGDAAASADFDKNGFLDLIIANGAGTTAGKYQLLRNSGNGNNWLRVIPTFANGSPAFGSQVWVWSGGLAQYRVYGDTSNAAASHEPVLHFGLGLRQSIDVIRVRWPDGTETEQVGIIGGQLLEIRQ